MTELFQALDKFLPIGSRWSQAKCLTEISYLGVGMDVKASLIRGLDLTALQVTRNGPNGTLSRRGAPEGMCAP